MTAKKPGDVITLGDVVGHPMEPGERWARVVAIRKDECRAIESVVIRMFTDAEERWPSGEYRTTAFLVAWEGAR